MQEVVLSEVPAPSPEWITPEPPAGGTNIGRRCLELNSHSCALAQTILDTAAERPRETSDTACVTSVGSEIGDAKAEEHEWTEALFATREVNDKVSEILIGAKSEYLGSSAATRESGEGIGLVVVPYEFDPGIITQQVNPTDSVVQSILHVDMIERGS